MSEEGNQHNNGPHQDKIFDNLSACQCGPKTGFGSGGWGVGVGGD